MLSHQLEQNRIDGEKTIIQVKPSVLLIAEGVLENNFRVSPFENSKNSCPCLQNPSEAQRKEHEKYEFALHEVYAVDVLISSGEGQVENFSDNKIFNLLF